MFAVLDLRNNPGGVFEEAVAMAVSHTWACKFSTMDGSFLLFFQFIECSFIMFLHWSRRLSGRQWSLESLIWLYRLLPNVPRWHEKTLFVPK